MNIIDLRENLTPFPSDNRASDRRKNPHPFGSPEWFEYIRANGLECPTHDRRQGPRRASDRRLHTQEGAERRENPYRRILLTAAEKKLLADMYLTDLDLDQA